jgi:hypothetical protein
MTPEREIEIRVGTVYQTKGNDPADLRVVFSPEEGDHFYSCGITNNTPGSERLALPGGSSVRDIQAVVGHWPVERVVTAYLRHAAQDGRYTETGPFDRGKLLRTLGSKKSRVVMV